MPLVITTAFTNYEVIPPKFLGIAKGIRGLHEFSLGMHSILAVVSHRRLKLLVIDFDKPPEPLLSQDVTAQPKEKIYPEIVDS